jgi:hypothetical protein
MTVINSRNVMEVSMLKKWCVVTTSWSVMSGGELFVQEDSHREHDEVENHESYKTEKTKLEAIRGKEV